jgi:hypothetical protein
MTTPHRTDGGALIPMPALTTAALRSAVAQIAPAHLGEFVAHLDSATEQAARQSTVAPLQNFLQWWGEFVAINRVPARAARLRELEQAVKDTTDRAALDAALSEIREISEGARREAAGE